MPNAKLRPLLDNIWTFIDS